MGKWGSTLVISLFSLCPGYYIALKARDPYKDVTRFGELISFAVQTTDGPKCVVFYFMMNAKSVSS